MTGGWLYRKLWWNLCTCTLPGNTITGKVMFSGLRRARGRKPKDYFPRCHGSCGNVLCFMRIMTIGLGNVTKNDGDIPSVWLQCYPLLWEIPWVDLYSHIKLMLTLRLWLREQTFMAKQKTSNELQNNVV